MYVFPEFRGFETELGTYGEITLPTMLAFIEGVILTVDDDGSGKLIKVYQKKGFEIVDEEEGGGVRMIGVKHEEERKEWKVDKFYT